MKVILVPARLRLASALLLLCVPLAALETVIVARAPWWRLPYRSIALWSSAVALICLPLSVWLMRGNRWAFRGIQVFFAAWVALNAWLGIRAGSPALGFLTVVLMASFGLLALWIRHELGRSFFDPRMRWFQGLPRPVPGLSCRVAWGDRELECRVARLDREGAFVFRGSPPGRDSLASLRPDVPSELTFVFRDRFVKCSALPMRVLGGGTGAGFQFGGLPSDSRKQLGDFIENLKGEGYVL